MIIYISGILSDPTNIDHLANFSVSLIKLQWWNPLMAIWTQYQEKYIIRSLPRPFICMYMDSDVFTVWIRWNTKTMSILLPSRVARYVEYCEHNSLLKIVALTTYSLSFEYYGRCYMEDDASVCIFKCMFFSSLLAGQCCWEG